MGDFCSSRHTRYSRPLSALSGLHTRWRSRFSVLSSRHKGWRSRLSVLSSCHKGRGSRLTTGQGLHQQHLPCPWLTALLLTLMLWRLLLRRHRYLQHPTGLLCSLLYFCLH